VTAIAVVRVRGSVGVRREIKDTLRFLHLTRANHCTVIPDTPSYRGMLQKVKDYVTWGEIKPDVLARMIFTRGELAGGEKITDEYVKNNTGYKSILALAEALVKEEVNYKDLPNVKPLFRLSPPRKGYEGVKRSYKEGGALGYRGEKINELLIRMLPPPEVKKGGAGKGGERKVKEKDEGKKGKAGEKKTGTQKRSTKKAAAGKKKAGSAEKSAGE